MVNVLAGPCAGSYHVRGIQKYFYSKILSEIEPRFVRSATELHSSSAYCTHDPQVKDGVW